MKDFFKKYWYYVIIGILLVFSVTQCTGKGNYERKYRKMTERCEFVTDSINSVYGDARHEIDSLNTVIEIRDTEIGHLKERNSEMEKHNRQLASKPVVVKVEK